MNGRENTLYKQLLEKSEEAFILGIELYNKPTIKYRVEGFSFMVCNAWELMLKAELVKRNGEESIYYTDDHRRTRSLSSCISRVFTNVSSPIRLNLEEIVQLRDTSTHFITQEYEMIYVPLFQACANNYCEKMMEFHGVDITKQIPMHFLNLNVCTEPLIQSELEKKYSPIVVDRMLKNISKIERLSSENETDRFAIVIKQDMRLVKSKDPNVPAFRYVKGDEVPDSNVIVLKERQDPNQTHPLTIKRIIELVNSRLTKESIDITITSKNVIEFIEFYGLKSNDKYCYENKLYTNHTFSYSMHTVDFIVSEVKKDTNCLMKIREELKRKKAKK